MKPVSFQRFRSCFSFSKSFCSKLILCFVTKLRCKPLLAEINCFTVNSATRSRASIKIPLFFAFLVKERQVCLVQSVTDIYLADAIESGKLQIPFFSQSCLIFFILYFVLEITDLQVANLTAELAKVGKPSGFATLDSNGRLPHNLLAAGYDKYSAYDLAWQSLHMAAAAACRGSTASGGTGSHDNKVMARNTADKKT